MSGSNDEVQVQSAPLGVQMPSALHEVPVDDDKAVKKAERARLKAERLAARPAKHTAKLITAKNKLPLLSDGLTEDLNDLTGRLTTDELESLSSHLAFIARQRRTVAAVDVTVTVGQVVRIIGGEHRYLNKVGEVVKANRIRCYVEVEGKKLYLFTSDVSSIVDEEVCGVPTDSSSENDSIAQAV